MPSNTIGRGVFELEIDTARLGPGLRGAEQQLTGLSGKMSSLGSQFSSFGSSVGNVGRSLTTSVSLPIAGIVGALTGLATATAATGDGIAKSARTAGVSAGAFQELGYAIGQVSDVSQDELTKGLAKMTTILGDAANGSKPAIDALERLGYSQEQIASGAVSTEDAFDRMAEAMQNAASPAEATALAADLLGERLGPRLAGALREGGDQVQVLRDQFNDLGLGMSDESLAASEEFNDSLDTLGKQLGAVGREIGSAVLPILTETLIPAMKTHVIPMFEKLAEWVKIGVDWFNELPGPVKVAAAAAVGLAAAAGPVLVVVGAIATAIGAALPIIGTIGTVLAALATGPIAIVVAAVVGLAALWWAFGDDITAIVSSIYTSVKEWLVDAFETVWSGIKVAVQTVVAVWNVAKDTVVGAAVAVYEGVKGSLLDRLEAVWSGIRATVEGYVRVWTIAKDAVIGAARALFEGVKQWLGDRLTGVFDTVKGAVDSVTGVFGNMYEAVVGGSFVPDMVEGIRAEFGKLGEVMVNPARSAASGVEGLFGSLADSVTGIFGNLFSSLTSQVSGFFGSSGIGGVISGGINSIISNVGGQLSSRLGGMVSGLFGGGGGAGGGILGGLFGGGAGGAVGIGASIATGAATMGIGLAVQGVAAWIRSASNDTKKDRQAFAKQFGGDQALWDQLNEAGRGDLVNQALNVIGKKDTAANNAWMQDVVMALEAAKTKASETAGAVETIGESSEESAARTGEAFEAVPEKTTAAAEETVGAWSKAHAAIGQLEEALTETVAAQADARTEDERDELAARAENYRQELERLRDKAGIESDHIKDALLGAFDPDKGLTSQVERIGQSVSDLARGIHDELGDLTFDIALRYDVEDMPGRPGLPGAETEPIPSFANRPLESVVGDGLAMLHRGDVVGVPQGRGGGDTYAVTINTTKPIDQAYMRGEFRRDLSVALREDPDLRRDINRGLNHGG